MPRCHKAFVYDMQLKEDVITAKQYPIAHATREAVRESELDGKIRV